MDILVSECRDSASVMDLLLLADPSEQMILQYLEDGKLYSASWEDVIVGVFVLIQVDDTLWELKNIAVAEEWQGKGVGNALLAEAVSKAQECGAQCLEVGTGNSSIGQLAFYQKAGFRLDRIAKNYFTLNYEEPIFENGIQCRDMVFLKKNLGASNEN